MCTALWARCGARMGAFVAGVLFVCAGAAAQYHSADTTQDRDIDLSELLRVIQFYNSNGLHCEAGTEDGYAPDQGGQACAHHDSDYSPADWYVTLSELLRLIQFYNLDGYYVAESSEDGWGPGSDPAPAEDLDGLGDYLGGPGGDGLPPGDRDEMLELLGKAGAAFGAGDPCGAAGYLESLLDMSQFLYKQAKDAKAAKAMNGAMYAYAAGRGLLYDILVGAPDDVECPNHGRIRRVADVVLEESDLDGLGGPVRFGEPRFRPVFGPGGEVFAGLVLPGTEPGSGNAGAPDLPIFRRLFAVPPGAQLDVAAKPMIAESILLNLVPVQREPFDQDDPPEPEFERYADPPFTIDAKLYGADRFLPERIWNVRQLGRARGIELVQLEVYGGQYNPVADELVLFEDVAVSVAFASKAAAGFLPERNASPFESNPDQYASLAINVGAVREFGRYPEFEIPVDLGEEFLILTHPDFTPAAQTLAAWKQEKGIQTQVFECGTGSGVASRDTNVEIDAFIEDRYNNNAIPPSYVLLLGDAEFIPPFVEDRLGGEPPDDEIGTDWPYAWLNPPGAEFPPLVPTFALGRIPVDTLGQANDVVAKIIAYESDPPGTIFGDAFYRNVTIASQFQCCRTDIAGIGYDQRSFIEVSEFARARLAGAGYTVERIYTETIDGGCAWCDPPRPAYTADATPRRYHDGTALPWAIGPASGFAWDGTTADILDAFEAGRFLILHRDHGWPGGWGHPDFSSWDLPVDTGEFQPVVFSINCSSGLFDNETSPGAEGTNAGGVYFAERLLRQAGGGAVGVIGDTRVSPSWPNSCLTRGLFDAIWPDFIPDFGEDAPKRRLGDILNHAKLYLATQIGVAGSGTSYADFVNELYLYHVIGDPTLEIWTDDPRELVLMRDFILESMMLDHLVVAYAHDGAVITAYQDTGKGMHPIGRGTVHAGKAAIAYFNEPLTGLPIRCSATAPNAVAANGIAEVLP